MRGFQAKYYFVIFSASCLLMGLNPALADGEVNFGDSVTESMGDFSIDETSGNPKSPADDVNKSGNSCTGAARTAKISCNGVTVSTMVMPLLRGFAASSGSGDMQASCEKAKQINMIAGGINTTFGVTCLAAQRKCVKACAAEDKRDPNWENYRDCRGLESTAYLAQFQTLMNAQAYVQSDQCSKYASQGDMCDTEMGKNNPNCPAFCEQPGREDHPMCRQQADNGYCQGDGAGTQFCLCQANPSAPECGGGGFEKPTFADTTPSFSDLDDFDDLPPGGFEGNEIADGGAQGVQGSLDGGGGGGFSPSGGDTGGGGGEGQGGEGDGPYDTDILAGTSGSSGGGASGGGGSYGSAGRRGGGGGAGSGNPLKGFDLKSLLPGGKNAKKRNLAGKIAGSDGQITAANGLSNFEKITRKMNQKRRRLLP